MAGAFLRCAIVCAACLHTSKINAAPLALQHTNLHQAAAVAVVAVAVLGRHKRHLCMGGQRMCSLVCLRKGADDTHMMHACCTMQAGWQATFRLVIPASGMQVAQHAQHSMHSSPVLEPTCKLGAESAHGRRADHAAALAQQQHAKGAWVGLRKQGEQGLVGTPGEQRRCDVCKHAGKLVMSLQLAAPFVARHTPCG